jgi:hypothetical protein
MRWQLCHGLCLVATATFCILGVLSLRACPQGKEPPGPKTAPAAQAHEGQPSPTGTAIAADSKQGTSTGLSTTVTPLIRGVRKLNAASQVDKKADGDATKLIAAHPVDQKVNEDAAEVQLGDHIRVEISHLREWMGLHAKGATPATLDHYVLYLDGIMLSSIHPLYVDGPIQDNGDEALVFRLVRPRQKDTGDQAKNTRERWAEVLGKPNPWDAFEKKVQVRVGYESDSPLGFDGVPKPITIKVIRPSSWQFLVSGVILIAAIIFFCFLLNMSDILRDPGPDPLRLDRQANKKVVARKPWSLALSQMAFWSFLTFGSYLFLWLITQDLDILPSGVVTLFGISVSTALGAVMLDLSKAGSTVKDLEERLKTAPEAEKPRISQELEQKRMELPTSKGFLTDVVSDGNGVSLHRFQMVVWTLILGLVFVGSVFNTLAMSEFSDTLLTLMGISGLSYVGFKWQEAPKKAEQPKAAA